MISASNINANGYSTIDYCNQNGLPSPPHYSDNSIDLKNINQSNLAYDSNTSSDEGISNVLVSKQVLVPNNYSKKIVIDMNNKINEITVLNSPIELANNQNVIISSSPSQYINSVNSYSPEIPINTTGNNVVIVEPYPSPCFNYNTLQDNSNNSSPLLKDDIVYTTVANNTNNQIMVIPNPNISTYTTVTNYSTTLASSSPNIDIITNINNANQTQNTNINFVNNYNFEVNKTNTQSTTLLPSQSLQQSNLFANENIIVNPTTFVDKNECMALEPSFNNVNNIAVIKSVPANAMSNIPNQTMNQMQPTNTTFITSPSQSEPEKIIIPPNSTVVINHSRPMMISSNVSDPNFVSPENSVSSEGSYISEVNTPFNGNHEIIVTNANLNEPSPISSPYKIMQKSISDPLMYCMSESSLSDSLVFEGPNNNLNLNSSQIPNNSILFSNGNVNNIPPQNVTYLNSNQVIVSQNVSMVNGQLVANNIVGINEGNNGFTEVRYIQRSFSSDDEEKDSGSGVDMKKRKVYLENGLSGETNSLNAVEPNAGNMAKKIKIIKRN